MLNLSQIARELGCTRMTTLKRLRKVRRVFPPVGEPPKWDPRVIDLLHAMRGEPHRALEPVHTDWLTNHLKGTSNAPTVP